MNSFDGSNLVALSWYDAGARSFYNTGRPIETLEDMRGLNIRVQESELMMDTIEALGATPVPTAFGDVYSGLQTGKIDGAENNWPSRHYEVARYFTLDEHTRVPELQLAAQPTWDKLSPEYQDIIRECAQESAQYERQLWAAREKVSESIVRKAGCIVTELSPEEKARFQEAPCMKNTALSTWILSMPSWKPGMTGNSRAENIDKGNGTEIICNITI